MLPRFHWSDITTVGHYLGLVIVLTGAAMCVPAVIALAFGEFRQLGAFIVGIGVCLVVGASLQFLRSYGLDRRRSLLLVGFGWMVIGFMCAVPLTLSGSYDSMFDALFDSVSALTSTGVTLLSDVDTLSYSQVTWRVVMSFTGAMTIIVIAAYSGFFGEGPKIFMMTGRKGNERIQPRIKETCFSVMKVYGAFAVVGIVVLTVVCLTLGLEPVDAFMNGVWLALTATGTGGFVAHTSELMYYHSLVLELVVCILMLAGAISFGVYLFARAGRFKQALRNSELRVYGLWLSVLVVIVISIMTRDGVFTTNAGLMQNGLVNVVSAATTCGMQSVYPEQIGKSISDGIVIWMIVAILFGACSYSTGGGIKCVRVLQVIRWIRYSILVRLAPDNARVRIKYEHFGSKTLSSKDAMVAMTIFILYLATAALGSMAFIAFGNDALNSVFESISYVSNCGMTTEITQRGLPFGLKVVALLLMWFGRVEFIALIGAVVGLLISIEPNNLFSNERSSMLREKKSRNTGGTAWRRRKRQRLGSKKVTAASLLVIAGVSSLLLSPSYGIADDDVMTQLGGFDPSSTMTSYEDVQIPSLLAASQRQDGRKVTFSGQAVGTPIAAGENRVWINIKSGNSMIGVCMDKGMADEVKNFARYEHTGDTVTVEGVFNLACPSHAGELDVHADTIEVAAEGHAWRDKANPASYVIGAVLIVIGLALIVHRMFRHQRFSFNKLLRKLRG